MESHSRTGGLLRLDVLYELGPDASFETAGGKYLIPEESKRFYLVSGTSLSWDMSEAWALRSSQPWRAEGLKGAGVGAGVRTGQWGGSILCLLQRAKNHGHFTLNININPIYFR